MSQPDTQHRPPVNEPETPDLLSFRALVPAVFQSNFTDNAFRMVVWLYLGSIAVGEGHEPDEYRGLTALFFAAPYLVLSLLAGQVADRFSKRWIVVWVKVIEVLVAFAGAAVMTAGGGKWSALIILLLLGTRLCFFGPATYGMIPELLPEKRLSWANGWIEGATYLGAILGVSAGGVMIDLFGIRADIPLLILGFAAVVGLVCTTLVDRLPAAEPSRRLSVLPIRDLKSNIAQIRRSPGLFWSCVGMIAWWGAAVLAIQTAQKMAQDSLNLTGFGTSRLFIYVGMGVGFGSYVAGRLSANKIELGLVPLGGVLMGLSFLITAFLPETEAAKGIGIATGGFFSGWFVVPLKAFVQHRATPESRGGILGTLNFFQYLAILLAGAPIYILMTVVLKLNGDQSFFALGLFAIYMGIFAARLIPGAGLRVILFLFANTVYRLRVVGRENVPEKGGALLVCNHMSYADGLLVIASMDRPVRPIMFDEIYEHPLVKPFAKLSNAIPVSSRMGAREMLKALHTASEAIKAGDLVVIFAEGQITRTGHLLPFRAGLERVMKGVEAPIIPMHLDRMWGSVLSFANNRWLQKWPRRIPWPVTVSFGERMAPTSTASEVRKAVELLATEAWKHRKSDARLLHHESLRMSRRRPFEMAMYDPLVPKGIRRYKFAAGMLAIAHALRDEWRDQEYVGICLPPSIGASMVNHAALLCGKVPVNLNYTVSEDVLQNIAEQCNLKTVITSTMFLEKINLKMPARAIMLEDVRKRIGGFDRLKALFEAMVIPVSYLERNLGAGKERSVDDTATIIFSSGSTGLPKGVMLSHWNIFSNVEAVGQVFSLNNKDCLLGILPFFHSFGTLATLFLPHSLGVRVAFYPNPLDARAVGEVVHRYRVTFLVATPTFLQNYTRRVEPYQFGSVQIVLTGAEKLKESVASAFERKFGVRPFEGYGTTECSPVVAVNTPDFRAPGIFQRSGKPGKIGLPLPGVTIGIVDPNTGEPLPDGQEGLLLVKGPNVMKGYLNMPEKTAEVLRDGWYVTGDIGKIDDDGFIEITDRLSRFSKIAGEMVPHVKVEEELNKALDLSEACFAVAGVADDKKGERLVVLYTVPEEDARRAHELVSNGGLLPNLWIPRFQDFHKVEQIPVLGTGKMDLRRIKEIAQERSEAVGGQK